MVYNKLGVVYKAKSVLKVNESSLYGRFSSVFIIYFNCCLPPMLYVKPWSFKFVYFIHKKSFGLSKVTVRPASKLESISSVFCCLKFTMDISKQCVKYVQRY